MSLVSSFFGTRCMSSIAAMLTAVWYDRGRRLSAVRSIELVVRNFRKKLCNVSVYNFC